MADCKPCLTPMEEKLKLSKASTVAKVNTTRYHNIVGRLCYLIHTQLDIVFAVGYVQLVHEDPKKDHWTATHMLKSILPPSKS